MTSVKETFNGGEGKRGGAALPSRCASGRAAKHLRVASVFAFALLLACGAWTRAAFASPGFLNPTFSGDGKVTKSALGDPAANNVEDFAGDIAFQTDGKIVAVGRAFGQTNSPGTNSGNFALVRFNPDGTLDDGTGADTTVGDSFGTGGVVITDFNGGFDEATCVVIQPDGKIIAAGYASANTSNDNVQKNFALARYNVNGSLDTGIAGDATPGDSFGTLGKRTLAFDGDDAAAGVQNSQDEIHDIALQGTKIVVSGQTQNNTTGFDFALARFTSTGAIDATSARAASAAQALPARPRPISTASSTTSATAWPSRPTARSSSPGRRSARASLSSSAWRATPRTARSTTLSAATASRPPTPTPRRTTSAPSMLRYRRTARSLPSVRF